MPKRVETQWIFSAVAPGISQWVDGFLVARKAEGRAAGTLAFYAYRLANFTAFCAARNVTTLEAIDAGLIRAWLLDLGERGHNPGGVHGHFRALRAFLRWWEVEAAPDGWRNPLRKVKAPKVPDGLQDPVALPDVAAMVAKCGADYYGKRDTALLLALLDTGARAGELLGLTLADVDLVTGEIKIQRGKGGKGRLVYLGQKARRAMRQWVRERGGASGPLWLTRSGERLQYGGLRTVLTRRAKAAGVSAPTAHDFRRACALALNRGGVDAVGVSRYLGHARLTVTLRYLKHNDTDKREAIARASPADTL